MCNVANPVSGAKAPLCPGVERTTGKNAMSTGIKVVGLFRDQPFYRTSLIKKAIRMSSMTL